MKSQVVSDEVRGLPVGTFDTQVESELFVEFFSKFIKILKFSPEQHKHRNISNTENDPHFASQAPPFQKPVRFPF